MAKFLGVDIAAILAKQMGTLVRALTLTRSEPGTRSAADPTAGNNPTETTHSGRGFVDSYKAERIDGTIIQQGDRKVLILAGTLPAGVVPQVNDRITIEGETLTVVSVERDPASATYTCQARR